MLLYVVTICAAVIFCALSAPLYALPPVGAGIVSGSALPALSGSPCTRSGGLAVAVYLYTLPGIAAPRGALCCSVCPPPLGAGIVSAPAPVCPQRVSLPPQRRRAGSVCPAPAPALPPAGAAALRPPLPRFTFAPALSR
jgi:hypothetical protein